jgi:hypothetical protein
MLPTRLDGSGPDGRLSPSRFTRGGQPRAAVQWPHVTAFGCRHDDLQRGSERFFHLSPTKKHPDVTVEQARWAHGTAGAAVG